MHVRAKPFLSDASRKQLLPLAENGLTGSPAAPTHKMQIRDRDYYCVLFI